jgi:hypothetical protein
MPEAALIELRAAGGEAKEKTLPYWTDDLSVDLRNRVLFLSELDWVLWGTTSTPTLLLLRAGRVIGARTGLATRELVDKFCDQHDLARSETSSVR